MAELHKIPLARGNRITTAIVLVISFFIKFALYLHYFQFEGDKLFQVIAAKNLLQGKDLAYETVSIQNLSIVDYIPLHQWPPGYSLLLALIYPLAGNWPAATIIADSIAIIAFLAGLYKLLVSLQLHNHITYLLLLFNAAMIRHDLSKPTDLLAVSALMWACAMAIEQISKDNQHSKRGFTIGLINSLPFLLRFMYVPTAMVIPVFLFIAGITRKNARLRVAGIYSFCTTLVVLTSMLLFQKLHAGEAFYAVSAGKGLFLGNVTHTYPFVLSSFLNLNFIQQQIALYTGIAYASLRQGAILINLFIATLMAVVFIVYLLNRRWRSFSALHSFILMAGCMVLMLFATLCYLSVTNNASVHPYGGTGNWTFLGDGRFYIFVFTAIPTIAAGIIYRKDAPAKKWLNYLFVTVLSFEIAHTGYFLVRRFEPMASQGGNVMLTPKAEEYLLNKVKRYEAAKIEVILTGSDPTIANWGIVRGLKGLVHLRQLNTSTPSSTVPVVLISVVEDEKLNYYLPILERENCTFENRINNLNIYSCLVLPE